MFTFFCTLFKWYATFFCVFLRGSSCTLLFSAGLSVYRKGNEMNCIQGLWCYTLRTNETCSTPRVLHFIRRKPLHLMTCCSDVTLNTWEKSRHIFKLANCLTAFFLFLQLMIVVLFFCKQLNISVHHLIYRFFNNLLRELSTATKQKLKIALQLTWADGQDWI